MACLCAAMMSGLGRHEVYARAGVCFSVLILNRAVTGAVFGVHVRVVGADAGVGVGDVAGDVLCWCTCSQSTLLMPNPRDR